MYKRQLLMSIFGVKIAVAYVTLGLLVAIAGGTLIERLHMERYVEEFIRTAGSVDLDLSLIHISPAFCAMWP